MQGKSLVINKNTRRLWKRFGSNLTVGDDIPQSLVMVPIVVGKELIGGITMQSFEREDAFPPSLVRLLETVAANMGTAIQNARLFNETERLLQETEQRAAELAIINSVGQAMSSQLDSETITRTVGDKVTEIFKADATSILLLDGPEGMIRPAFEYEEGQYLEIEPFPVGTGLTSRVISSRQPLVLGSAEEAAAHGAYYPPESEALNSRVTQSYLGVPIVVGQKVLGVVAAQTYTLNAYNQDSVRLLSTVANNMGVALENARLFDETARLLKETVQRAAELAIINSVQQGLASKLDMRAIYDLVGDQIHEIFAAETMMISMIDPQTKTMEHLYLLERGLRLAPMSEPSADPLRWEIIRSGSALVINEHFVERCRELGMTDILVGESPKSWLGVPIIRAGGQWDHQPAEISIAKAPSTIPSFAC
jgi:GAF domain-containing protein